MKVKKGDKVKVTTGKYRGTEGLVIRVDTKKNGVVVEGVNVRKRAVKQDESNKQGFIFLQHPVHVSNVKVLETNANLVKEVKTEAQSEKKKALTKTSKSKLVK